MAENIRVGLIRCDTHGMWYGPIMAEHDAKLLQRPMPPHCPHSYTWQVGGCHTFFYTNYADPLQMTAPFVGGFEITRLWDEDCIAAEMAARVFFGKPKVCENFDEVSDDVDLVFIADCNYDGSDHLHLARPGLEKGVSTFIDKPFADTVANARALLDLAERHGALLFSLSILRADPSVARFRSRLPEVGEVNFATLQGYGTHPAGLVHTVSATQHIFGSGIQKVQVLEAERHTSVYLDYGERSDRPGLGVMINCDVGRRPYTAIGISVYGTKDDIHTMILGDLVYPDGTAEIVRMIKRMVETSEVPPLMDEVLESIAVIEAFHKARQTGKPATVVIS